MAYLVRTGVDLSIPASVEAGLYGNYHAGVKHAWAWWEE